MERNGWLGVEVRHLAALASVCRNGSFRGAADELGYVQSAVSQQIARLESVVGTRLVERTRGHASVALTPAGQVLLEHAEEILGQLGAAQSELDRLAGRETELLLRLGVVDGVAARVLPACMARLAVTAPGLRVTALGAGAGEDPARQVAAGELDAALMQLPAAPGPLEQLELFSEPLVVMVPADSALARRDQPLSPEELTALPLVEHASWRLDGVLDAPGRVPRFVHSSNLDKVVEALVAAGHGVAVVPRLQAESLAGADLAVLELSGDVPPLRMGLLWSRHRDDEAVGLFRQAALDTCTPAGLVALPAAAVAA
jgi:DNA-binding transcriptional LysR family regulator